MNKITEEEKEKIKSFGALGYDNPIMLILLGWDKKDFLAHISDENSEFNRLHKKGELEFRYMQDIKLMELAIDGDMKAMEYIEKRKNNM